jgi:SAM-dependent methyltransferase
VDEVLGSSVVMVSFDPVLSIAQRARQLVVARLRLALGLPAGLSTPDRRLLESSIFPALAGDPTVHRLLFAGCDWYTAHYERLLPGLTCHTLDPDARRARYGARRHVVAALQDAMAHFAPGHFGAIVCNGVYGWGLDRREDCERALRVSAALLRPGGRLVFGWNDVPAHDPVPLSTLPFEGFTPAPLPGLSVARLRVDGSDERHTFACYRRSAEPLGSW